MEQHGERTVASNHTLCLRYAMRQPSHIDRRISPETDSSMAHHRALIKLPQFTADSPPTPHTHPHHHRRQMQLQRWNLLGSRVKTQSLSSQYNVDRLYISENNFYSCNETRNRGLRESAHKADFHCATWFFVNIVHNLQNRPRLTTN